MSQKRIVKTDRLNAEVEPFENELISCHAIEIDDTQTSTGTNFESNGTSIKSKSIRRINLQYKTFFEKQN